MASRRQPVPGGLGGFADDPSDDRFRSFFEEVRDRWFWRHAPDSYVREDRDALLWASLKKERYSEPNITFARTEGHWYASGFLPATDGERATSDGLYVSGWIKISDETMVAFLDDRWEQRQDQPDPEDERTAEEVRRDRLMTTARERTSSYYRVFYFCRDCDWELETDVALEGNTAMWEHWCEAHGEGGYVKPEEPTGPSSIGAALLDLDEDQ